MVFKVTMINFPGTGDQQRTRRGTSAGASRRGEKKREDWHYDDRDVRDSSRTPRRDASASWDKGKVKGKHKKTDTWKKGRNR